MIRFTLFDRWGEQIGVLDSVIEAVWTDEVNGEDSLTLLMPERELVKGQRVVWRDKWLSWHEHIISDVSTKHAEGRTLTTAFCVNSLDELHTDYVEHQVSRGETVQGALYRVLQHTTWQSGQVSLDGVSSKTFYHENAYECLQGILDAWGGEVWTTIEVAGPRVTGRFVNWGRRGGDHGKRFTYGRDLVSIVREVSSDDVVTAIYGYGKGVERLDEEGEGAGSYERRLTFGDINGGKDYVADEAAKLVWGKPDDKGGVRHAVGYEVFGDCEDKGELLRLTKEALAERSKPRVSYSANVVSLADAGLEWEDCRTGDDVVIIDKELGERLKGRVLASKRYLLNEACTELTIGNLRRTATRTMASQKADLEWLGSRSHAWDSAANLDASYVHQVIGSLNATLNQTGGYTYFVEGEGIYCYDKPIDQNPTQVIHLGGGFWRCASTKNPDGSWNYTTVGNGSGLYGDALTVGTIKGGSNYWNLETGDLVFKQGQIRSANGNSYWNLSTDELVTHRMKAYEMEATGSFTCGPAAAQLRVADGRVRGYHNGELSGSVDFTAAHVNTDTGKVEYGPNIYGSGVIRLCSPEIMVAQSSDNGAVGRPALTTTVDFKYVKEITDSGSSWKVHYGTRHLEFVNGLLVAYTGTE